jgi:hypothetical protein
LAPWRRWSGITGRLCRPWYELCESPNLEAVFEKIAIEVLSGAVKHVARKLLNGRWSSKLDAWGPVEDDYAIAAMVKAAAK